MKLDGTMGSDFTKSDKLFDFEKEGDLYSIKIPTDQLAVGIMNTYRTPATSVRLRNLRIFYATADQIYSMGQNNVPPQGF